MNLENPFELVTASKLSADDAVGLWCDDRRLAKVEGRENCFVNGLRGTGKTMLFRILQYDCQKKLKNGDVPFISVYIPVRDTDLMAIEHEQSQSDALVYTACESQLTLLFTRQLLTVLRVYEELIPENERGSLSELLRRVWESAFTFSSRSATPLPEGELKILLQEMDHVIDEELYAVFHGFLTRRIYDTANFDGPLFLFDRCLGTICDWIEKYTSRMIYFLVDDADDLPPAHTVVLNTWIARRRSSCVFKVSTMYRYKTYETRGRSAIQHPHDFFKYEVATRHLNRDSEDYPKLLEQICKKRLSLCRITQEPAAFFPADQNQEEALAKFKNELTEEYAERYSGRELRDYVYRHLTSEFKKRKLGNAQFSYAGFKTLAELSGGLVRDFIIWAQQMYDAQNAPGEALSVERVAIIEPRIQNSVVREQADELLASIGDVAQKRDRNTSSADWTDVARLIRALGEAFKKKMYSGDSERRVFSFALQDEADPKVKKVLELAMAEGYLVSGFISSKEGTGRRLLYVLTRRLAPAFDLDVSSYSGYLSTTNAAIGAMISTGKANFVEDSKQLQLIESYDGEWVPVSEEEVGS